MNPANQRPDRVLATALMVVVATCGLLLTSKPMPAFALACRTVYQTTGDTAAQASSAISLPANDDRRNQIYLKLLKVDTFTNQDVWKECDSATIFNYNLSVLLESVLVLTLPPGEWRDTFVKDSRDADFILTYGLDIEPYVDKDPRLTSAQFRSYIQIAHDAYLYFHEPMRCEQTYAFMRRWLPDAAMPELRPTAGYCPVISPPKPSL